MAVTPIHRSPGKLAVLLPGLGAVATTFVAGVDAIRRGHHQPVGSLAMRGEIEDEKISDLVSLASLDSLVFGGWDIYEGSAFGAADRAGVLNREDLDRAKEVLSEIQPMTAVFDKNYIVNIDGPNVKSAPSKMELAEQVMEDIQTFKTENDCVRAVGVWCGSTERYVEIGPVHQTLERFEEGLKANHPDISPAMIYTYAFVKSGVPIANGAPNLACDVPAIVQLAEREGVAIAGRDFKTGQTLMKTILGPGFASRLIGVRGWYSTNILGNTDGAVLDDPGSFKTKEKSKLSVIESVLDGEKYPELYKDLDHVVRIDYYPPRGDNKEGWDNIDIFGWMNYPMQIKINFLCRDSILAAPLVLDLALFMDLSQRQGSAGVQDWLSFYFKAPQRNGEFMPPHDLFKQLDNLHDTIRKFANAGTDVVRAAK